MNSKDAVKIAKDYVAEMYADESATNIGLEEVYFETDKNNWRVTIGFSRPWNTVKNALTTISGESGARRTFKVLTIRDNDGQVLSLTSRETANA